MSHSTPEKRRLWRAKNAEKIRAQWRALYYRKREERILRTKEWVAKNRARYRAWHRKYKRDREKTDVGFKIRNRLQARIFQALKGINKTSDTLELLGCSIEHFRKHIEDQFEPGMSWANYGKWHIDHFMPCARFDLIDALQQRICFHFTNLQPMWAKDNLSKGAKCPWSA